MQIKPADYTGVNLPFTVELRLENNLPVYGPIQMTPGQAYTTSVLSPGFYVTSVLSQANAPDAFFGVDLTAPSIYGGVVGGWLDSKTGPGYAAFSVNYPQTVTFELMFDGIYGSAGTGQPSLQIYYQKQDGTRELYWIAANVTEKEPNDEPAQATPIPTYPWSVSGTIQVDNDGDYFKFPGNQGDIITAVITKTDPLFKPMLSIEKTTGQPLRNATLNLGDNNTYSDQFTAQLPYTGDFYLFVSDQNGGGSPNFTYTVSLFIDNNLNGLDDNVESTLGIMNQSPDADGDSILDGVEVKGNQDADGDGTPNWMDLDSDNDGISDRQEGSADADGDGLGNFVDADADNNGISDKDEIGSNPKQPLDFDNDDTSDYVDTDDDNDGLLDSNDDNRVAAIPSSDILDLNNRVYLESSAVAFGDKVLVDVARPGDTLILKGAGFAPTAADNKIIFKGENNQSLNLTPSVATATELTVVVPEGVGSRVAVVTRGQRSNWLGLQILAKTAPVLLELDTMPIVRIGDKVTLTGLNLAGVVRLYFDRVVAPISAVTDNSIEAIVPADAVSGQVTVANAQYLSNPISLKVTREIPAQVVLPAGSPVNVTSLIVSFGPIGEAIPDVTGNVKVDVDNSGMDMVYAMLPESGNQPMSVFLQAVTLPGDASVTLDSVSTVVAMIMMGVTFEERTDIAQIRTDLSNLPEVITASSVLQETLRIEPHFSSNSPSSPSAQSYYQSLQVAFSAAQQVMTATTRYGYGLRSTTKQPKPEILPKEEQNGVKIIPLDGSNFGNVGVDNHTPLYLSAKFSDSNNHELFGHITGYSDSNMVSPRGGPFLLFWSSKKNDYNLPKGKDCKVEIVTPGTIFSSPKPPKEVWKYLAAQTFANGILMPLVSGWVISPLISDKIPSQLVDTSIAYYGSQFFVLLDKIENNPNDGFSFFEGMLMDEINNVREGKVNVVNTNILRALVESTVGSIPEKIGGKQLGILASVLNAGVIFYQTASAFRNTPALFTFEVKWPLQVENVDPSTIKKSPDPINVTLIGRGFEPVEDQNPQITLTDDGGGASSITIEPDSVTAEQIEFTLPGDFRNAVVGPITVKVTHKGLEATAQIKVASKLEITELSPNTGNEGMNVTITGAGFDPDLAKNTVTFQKEGGGPPLTAKVASVNKDGTKLVVIVPPGVKGDENAQGAVSFEVLVQVGDEVSNPLTFTVSTECNEGASPSGSGSESESRTLYLGRKSGTFLFSYGTYEAEDQMVIKYEGKVLFDTTCTSTPGQPPETPFHKEISYSGESNSITVTVTAKCRGDETTKWSYKVGCPQKASPQPPAPPEPPKDDDGDGVMNDQDQCPGTPADTQVDANGCPRDSDNDGVTDDKDSCPDTPVGTQVDTKGCPLDGDNDGVTDDKDSCPNTPAGTKVDTKGCPPDSDNDGVTDDKDSCPDTPAGTKVDAKGCTLAEDSDGDGVINDQDQCPGTPAGDKVNAEGCTETTFIPVEQCGQNGLIAGTVFVGEWCGITGCIPGAVDNVPPAKLVNTTISVTYRGLLGMVRVNVPVDENGNFSVSCTDQIVPDTDKAKCLTATWFTVVETPTGGKWTNYDCVQWNALNPPKEVILRGSNDNQLPDWWDYSGQETGGTGTGTSVIIPPEPLLDFKAAPQTDNKIRFEWTTVFETGLTGFKLWQATPPNGTCQAVVATDFMTSLTEELIVITGTSMQGMPYVYDSSTALPNQCYGLEWIWTTGKSTLYIVGPGIEKWKKVELEQGLKP